MQQLKVVEIKGIRVLTTEQLAKSYGTTSKILQYNFSYNKKRYTEGKHYIALQGEELKSFKADLEIQGNLKYAHTLYLWTEKGALLHAKSLNTDKAWEVYDYLVDFYFRVKEGQTETKPVPMETKPIPVEKPKKQEFPHVEDPISAFRILLKIADDRDVVVKSKNFGLVRSVLKGNRIGISTKLLLEEVVYELAWELSHSFIHYNNGDLINSPLSKDYNEQASRAAEMVIKMLNVKMS